MMLSTSFFGKSTEHQGQHQARSQDFEGEVSADGAHAQCICAHAYAHCLTHYDVTPPLHITCMKKSMKYTYTNKCL